MATTNPDTPVQDGNKTSETPTSPPPKSTRTTAAAASGIPRPKTERPTEPKRMKSAFNIPYDEEAIIGNPTFTSLLKIDGQLGIFYDRPQTHRIPTFFTMDAANYYNSVCITLQTVIRTALEDEANIEMTDMIATATQIALAIADGIMVLTYLKLKAQNSLFYEVESVKFRKRPAVPTHFEVPEPYALAISQLGVTKPSGLTTERPFAPTATAEACANYLLPENRTWSPANYARAVDVAKRLKIRFSTVDLSVKMGSTWWLYVPETLNDCFYLSCPIPEENFTPNSAVLASLFCVNLDFGFENPLFDLTALTDRYGTMLRDPPTRIDLSTFYAIESMEKDAWMVT